VDFSHQQDSPYYQEIPFSEAEYLSAFRLVMSEAEAASAAAACAAMPNAVSRMNAAEVERSGLEPGTMGAGDSWGWEPEDQILVLLSLVSPPLYAKVRKFIERRWGIFEKGLRQKALSRPGGATERVMFEKGVQQEIDAMRKAWFELRDIMRVQLGLPE
jgi:hypothetical protein